MFRRGFVGNKLQGFKRDEDGSLIIFSMYIFMAMIVFGCIAVDLMLSENRRVHVQNCTDRSALVGANLIQANLDRELTAEDVVYDSLVKCGVVIDRENIDVFETATEEEITGRRVSVVVSGDYQTILMDKWLGVDSLPIAAVSEANEGVTDVEVSLVLDISGSMGSPSSKLTNMQDAAKSFVAGVIGTGEDADERVSISLVPYSTQVSVGPELLSRLTIDHAHDFSHCVNFVKEDFETTMIQRYEPVTDEDGEIVTDEFGNAEIEIVPLSQTASFDPFRSYASSRSHLYPICRNTDYVDILPWSNSVDDLQDRIDDFTANGNTSIDVAVKWGTALLDPSMNAHLRSMEADETLSDELAISSSFLPRPHAHTYPDVQKFLVVMTDGINTAQYYLSDDQKEGMSDMYWERDDHWLRVGDNYWNADDRCWHYQNRRSCNGTAPDEDNRLTNLEMWEQMTLPWRAYHAFYRRTGKASDFYSALYDPLNWVNANSTDPFQDTKDNRLSSICTAAKNAGIIIFSIGFEVTDDSADVMQACASSENHFYRVNGEDIQYAFSSIKNQINTLRLTQ